MPSRLSPPRAGGTVFKLNPEGVAAIGRSQQMTRAMVEAGLQIAAVARQSAPYRQGHLSGSIIVDAVAERGVLGARVVVTDFKGHWYEFGTSRGLHQPFLWPATEQVLAGRARLDEGGAVGALQSLSSIVF